MPSLSTPGGVGVSPSEKRITARRTRRPRRSSAWMTICGLRMPTSTSATSKRRSRQTRAAAAPLISHWYSMPRSSSAGSSSGLELLAADDQHARAARADRGAEHVAQLVGVDRLGHDPLAGQLLTAREHRHEHDRGARAARGRERICCRTSKPSIPGIRMSSVTASYWSVRSSSSASSPLSAIVVWTSSGASWLGDQLGDLGLVVDHQHVAAADRLERRGRVEAGHGGGEPDPEDACPRPGSDSTPICPPCRSTSDLTIDSPRPVPGVRAAAVAGAVEAVEDPLELLLGVMPTPESWTTICTQARSGSTPTWMRAALGRVEVRVGQQVGHDLADPRRHRPAPAAGWGRRRRSSRWCL